LGETRDKSRDISRDISLDPKVRNPSTGLPGVDITAIKFPPKRVFAIR
jgi:hypothetical protein